MANDSYGSFFHLYSDDLPSIDAASERFGRDKGLLVARPGRYMRPYFSIPEGFYALVTRWNKDIDHPVHGAVWPANFYPYYPPWYKVSNLISKQSVCFNMPVKEVMTQDNMPVAIDLAIVFRIMGDEKLGEDPSLVRNFVYKVTPRGLEQQLTDACEEATRSVARGLLHTEVYGLRMDVSGKAGKVIKGAEETVDEIAAAEGEAANYAVAGPSSAAAATAAMAKGKDVASDMKRTLNEQFEPQGVMITDVIITGVKLKPQVVQQMSEKTMVIAQLASQKMTQEYQMLTTKQARLRRPRGAIARGDRACLGWWRWRPPALWRLLVVWCLLALRAASRLPPRPTTPRLRTRLTRRVPPLPHRTRRLRPCCSARRRSARRRCRRAIAT